LLHHVIYVAHLFVPEMRMCLDSYLIEGVAFMIQYHVKKYQEITLDLHHVIMLTLSNFSILNNVQIS